MVTNHDVESIVSTSDTFCAAPTIAFDLSIPIGETTKAILERCDTGAPFVVTGIPLIKDDEQSPFRQSTEWLESIYTNRGRPIPRVLWVVFLSIPQLVAMRQPTPAELRAPTTFQVRSRLDE